MIPFEVCAPSNVPLFMNVPPAGEGEEEWQKKLVNGSQNVVLKGLKGGLSYSVRLVAKGHHDQLPHLSEELLVSVPGEAVPPRSPPPRPGLAWLGLAPCPMCGLCRSLCRCVVIIQCSMGLTDVLWWLCVPGTHCLERETVCGSVHDCVVSFQREVGPVDFGNPHIEVWYMFSGIIPHLISPTVNLPTCSLCALCVCLWPSVCALVRDTLCTHVVFR